MSDTPESTPASLPAETRAAQQSELCFGEAETQNEMQIEMRFETDEAPAETPVETQTVIQKETRVETPIDLQDKTLIVTQIEGPVETQTATPVELQSETRIEKQSETPIETQAETRVGTQTETRVEIERIEIENGKQAEKPVVTRSEPQAVTLNDRPFRVKLRGSVLVLIRLPNKRQLRAALHQLSTTGGVINLEKPLDEKIEVELIFHIDHSTIRGKAQMLFPMWATQGWMQPFRFVELTDTDRNALQENLQSFIGNMAKGASAAS
jgi:hypothetical protein